MKASDFFNDNEKKAIVEAIRNAELDTSGEIRVHIELHCKSSDVRDCAANAFAMLKMHKTKLRNGVLFYIAVLDRKFAIIGDVGINKVVPPNFWDEIKEKMENFFKEEKFVEGLITGIMMAGEKLKVYFPRMYEDINELSDEISFEQ